MLAQIDGPWNIHIRRLWDDPDFGPALIAGFVFYVAVAATFELIRAALKDTK